jgi:cyanate permease
MIATSIEAQNPRIGIATHGIATRPPIRRGVRIANQYGMAPPRILRSAMPHFSASHPWYARLPFFYGWIIVGIGFISSVFSIGLTWTAGLLAVPMGADLQWSRSEFFFAVSMRGWIGILVTPFIGSYLDRQEGPRRLALIGGVINTVSLLLIPFVDSAWQFLVLFGVLGGLSQAAQGGISAAIVPKWFVQQRGSAVAISTIGGGFAAIFLPAFLAGLTSAAGWRQAWLAIGVLAFVLGTLPAFLMHREPEDLGLLPDGRQATARPRIPASGYREEPGHTLHEALHTSAFWTLLVGIGLGSLANNGLPATLAPIFVDRGFSFEIAASSLVWYGIASTATKFVWGWAANRFPIRGVLLVLTLYGTLALPSVLLIPAVGPMAYGFLIGAYIGAYFFLSQMVWAEYFGRTHVGAISALGRPVGLLIGASGPFILALTRDITGSFDLGIALNAVSAALCFGCLMLVRPVTRPAPSQPSAPAGTAPH